MGFRREKKSKRIASYGAWFERAEKAVAKNKGIMHAKKLSAIYQFPRAISLLFVPVSQNKVDDTKKRT